MKIVKWYLSDQHACGHIRAEVPAREINKSFSNWLVTCRSDVMLSDFYKTNIAVFQRTHRPELYARMLAMKQKFGIKTIYEIDDDFLNTPPEFEKPYEVYQNPDVRKVIGEFLNGCNLITASTKALAESLAPRTSRPIAVVPNFIDVDMWQTAYAQRIKAQREKREVVIGWMASGSHQMDAPLVEEALYAALEKDPRVRVVFVGWIGFDQFKSGRLEKHRERIKVIPWIEINSLPFFLATFDIGIAPLKDCGFNQCKSGIKYMQYGSLGIPTVMSPLRPYTETVGQDCGLFAEGNSIGSWVEKVLSLLDDGVREKVGFNARLDVLKRWDIKSNAHRLVEAFELALRS